MSGSDPGGRAVRAGRAGRAGRVGRPADLETSLPARFAAQVRRAPDACAVWADDGQLTYAELHRLAIGIAAAIEAAPARVGGHVGVLLGHGVRAVAAIMGVLLSGRAYVPLDPGYPKERLGYMLRHSRADLLLVEPGTAALAGTLAGLAGRPDLAVLAVSAVAAADPPAADLPAAAAGDRDRLAAGGAAGPDSVAYLLYTSGSTGRPKGVRQNHRNVLFQVRHHTGRHRIGPRDRVSVLSSFSFDASVTDLFSALLSGAAAVLVDIRRHGLGHLAQALAGRGVTVYHSTPTVYRYLLGALGEGERLPAVRVVLLGGEELTGRDVRLHRAHFAEHCVFVNGYGATEVSFACQDHLTIDSPIPDGVLPVGRPLPGLEVLLVGADGRPALAGEIVVRSPHVSIGYWDDPDADRAKFAGYGGVRGYRTGDLGRRLPDGRIVFTGRSDRQVKVRGYRVELGEVEAALADLPGVAHAAAVARPEQVVAYAVPVPGGRIDPAGLRAALARRLPEFMVPAAVVGLAELPLTPTGKVDTERLPEPPAGSPAGGRVAPRDPMQRLVADAWCAVLGVPAVDPDTNFFDAGGHSLLVAWVAHRLESALGRPVPLHRLYRYPTVAALARFLSGPGSGPDAGPEGGLAAGPGAEPGAGPDAEPAAGPGERDTGGLDQVAERMARRRARGQSGARRAR